MYEEFTRFTDELTVQALDQVIGGGIQASLGVIRGVLMIYVLVIACMVWGGRMGLWEAIVRGVRGAAVVMLLQASTYNSWVREFFWVTVPNAIASGVAGGTVSITAAQRFDRVAAASAHAVALVDARLSFYTVRANFSVAVADAAMQVAIAVSYASWFFCRIATAVLICAGAYIILAYLFDTTRGWVMGWISKLVGVALATLMTAIVVELMLAGTLFWARRTAANANGGVFEATDALWKLAAWFIVMAIIMVATPFLAFVGGSAAAASSLGSSAAMGAMQVAGNAVGGAAGAAGRAARAARTASNKNRP